MLFDWCRPMSGPKGTIMKILRFIVIFLAFAYSVLIPALSGTELIHSFSTKDIETTILLLTVLGWMLLSFTIHFILLLRHKQLMTFFQDFKENLAPLNNMPPLYTAPYPEDGSKKHLILTYILYFAIVLVFMVMNSNQLIGLFNGATTSFLTVFTLCLLWLIFMSSKLYTSAARLRAAVLSFKSRSNSHFYLASEEKAINSLLTQLQDDKLAASPMALYSITPSTLLSLLYVVATYVIMIWQ